MEQPEKHPNSSNSVIIASTYDDESIMLFLNDKRRTEKPNGKFLVHDIETPNEIKELMKEGKLEGVSVTFTSSDIHGLPADEGTEMLYKIFFLKTIFFPFEGNSVDFFKAFDMKELIDNLMNEWEMEKALG